MPRLPKSQWQKPIVYIPAVFPFDPKRYPETPGCYIMLNQNGDILYIGKAINLRARLSSYFHGKPDRHKTARLIPLIADIELILVRTESESLTLERELIKHYQPPFNRALKKGPSVLSYIGVTEGPVRLLVAHDATRFLDRSAQRFHEDPPLSEKIGPFDTRHIRNSVLEHAIDSFNLPDCSPMPNRCCFRYLRGTCGGICEGLISIEGYEANLQEALRLLHAPFETIVQHMQRRMMQLADQLRFERAQRLKVQLDAIGKMQEKQSVNQPSDRRELFVWFGDTYALVAYLEDGTLRRRLDWVNWAEKFGLLGMQGNSAKLALLQQLRMDFRPMEIITNFELPSAAEAVVVGANEAEAAAGNSKERLNVKLSQPKRGRKKELLALCELNYEYRLEMTKRT
ncbi:GIY-YIG nuclease family protein [Paenibacillus koleovorans]|uniref:GIY-YIG nuclease family protein n=1 Tax=Paenibacillus koleovorans TaxID=121608 RepID=UPI0013E2FF78|nr:GIY-YIG nuclease family protein [Paenibacillus koleovorans]